MFEQMSFKKPTVYTNSFLENGLKATHTRTHFSQSRFVCLSHNDHFGPNRARITIYSSNLNILKQPHLNYRARTYTQTKRNSTAFIVYYQIYKQHYSIHPARTRNSHDAAQWQVWCASGVKHTSLIHILTDTSRDRRDRDQRRDARPIARPHVGAWICDCGDDESFCTRTVWDKYIGKYYMQLDVCASEKTNGV